MESTHKTLSEDTCGETISINNRDNVAVSNQTFLVPDMKSCPIGVKVQLLNKGGVLVYGNYDGKSKDWLAWAPLPRIRKDNNAGY